MLGIDSPFPPVLLAGVSRGLSVTPACTARNTVRDQGTGPISAPIWTRELPDADAIPVDIDVHPIPANPAKSEQDHWHADFRYVIKARRPDTITIQAEEVSSYNWLLPSLLHHRRLAAKIAPVAAA
ncbi:MAG: hypothetical protein ABSA53_23555 [Streptosporangiaceae bacterium]